MTAVKERNNINGQMDQDYRVDLHSYFCNHVYRFTFCVIGKKG